MKDSRTKEQKLHDKLRRLADRAGRARDRFAEALSRAKETDPELYKKMCEEFHLFEEAGTGDWMA